MNFNPQELGCAVLNVLRAFSSFERKKNSLVALLLLPLK